MFGFTTLGYVFTLVCVAAACLLGIAFSRFEDAKRNTWWLTLLAWTVGILVTFGSPIFIFATIMYGVTWIVSASSTYQEVVIDHQWQQVRTTKRRLFMQSTAIVLIGGLILMVTGQVTGCMKASDQRVEAFWESQPSHRVISADRVNVALVIRLAGTDSVLVGNMKGGYAWTEDIRKQLASVKIVSNEDGHSYRFYNRDGRKIGWLEEYEGMYYLPSALAQ